MTKIFKEIFCRILYFLGITPLIFYFLFRNRDRALILLYHRIQTPETKFDTSVRSSRFEEHLCFVKKYFQCVSASELMDHWGEQKKSARPVSLVTFDDGYEDNFSAAYPVLKKHQVPAVIFLATGSIGTDNVMWTSLVDEFIKKTSAEEITLEKLGGRRIHFGDFHHRMKVSYEVKTRMKQVPDPERNLILQELKEKTGFVEGADPVMAKEMLSWDQVKLMARDPLVEFGSHSVSHRMLGQLSPEEVREELHESKVIIEREIGKEAPFVSYPGNSYHDGVRKAAEEVGYRAAFSVNHRLQRLSGPRFELNRIHVEDESLYVLIAEITGVLSWFRVLLWRKNL